MSTGHRKFVPLPEELPRIVVGVDGSACSRHALHWALREAKRAGAALEAIRAWADPWSLGGPPTLAGAGQAAVDAMYEELAQWIGDAARAEEATDVSVLEEVLPGDPAHVLVERSRGAEMLVVGNRGLGLVGRMLLGSVSRRCLEGAHVPVVVVPQPIATSAEDEHRDRRVALAAG